MEGRKRGDWNGLMTMTMMTRGGKEEEEDQVNIISIINIIVRM